MGKTLLKFLLLDKKPPDLRNSTPGADAPVQIEVRTVSAEQFRKLGKKWKEVSTEKILPLIARYIRSIALEKGEAIPEELKAYFEQVEVAVTKTTSESAALVDVAATSADATSTSADDARAVHIDLNIPVSISGHSTNEASILKEMIDSVLDKLKKLIAGEGLTEEEVEELFSAVWVYLTDSGGQPQFHELLPLFVKDVSSVVVVSRLCDRLDEYPLDEYYKDDELVGRCESSHLTNEDQIKSLIRSLLSRTSADSLPKVLMVGTHHDKAEECSESVDQKNEKLIEMLGPEFAKQLVYYQPFKKLIFPLNALNPGPEDNAVAESIRSAVESSTTKQVKVPIWWYVLQLLIQGLAKKLGKKVLSRQLCASIAQTLGFTEESFEAALKFFDELNVIKYSSVLPEVVFVDSQVPLDKLSELVQHSYKLKHGYLSTPLEGDWKRFCDEGIVTLNFLSFFPKHYAKGLFEAPQLLKLLEDQLVAVPLATIDSPLESFACASEYFMPALLDILSRDDLDKHRVFSSAAAPLLFLFSHGCRRAGLFCCLAVQLMMHSKWLIQHKDGSLILVARNCITFRHPRHSLYVTLIDAFYYIEVHLEASAGVCHKACPIIREEIRDGMKSACEKLKYVNDCPQLAVFCPHPTYESCQPPSTELRHAAVVEEEDDCCMCTKTKVITALAAEHKIWLQEASQGMYNFYHVVNSVISYVWLSTLPI